ncbi:hypothetical protein [Mycobacterium sp. DL99]|uniref:hypothetical protein n=1 Tax=Mycobacterium sp. DL99 TaxID=2528957 RepID=UPI001AEC0ED9|nr:hypothetical protein [Mycobacterium sp. DL99]
MRGSVAENGDVDNREPEKQMAGVRALLMEWDAIGVADAVECQDEYDCMIGPLLGHIRSGADAVFLHGWIARERVDHFGLNPDFGADRKLAEALVSWRDGE